MNVYKLGTNWGSDAPDFYNLLLENNFVLNDKQNFDYAEGDIVLICEKRKVEGKAAKITKGVAIARVGKKMSVEEHSNKGLEEALKAHDVIEGTYSHLSFRHAKIEEITEEQDYLKNPAQLGICQVHDTENRNAILKKAKELKLIKDI